MKDQFQSIEVLCVRLPPFMDSATGSYIVGGTDVCTLTVKSPGSTVTTPTATWDPDVQLWVYDIPLLDYEQGEWRIKAVSDAANALPQWRVYTWGDYVDTLETLRLIETGRWKVDIATNQLILYAADAVTPLYVFDLKGMDGLPNPHMVYERVAP